MCSTCFFLQGWKCLLSSILQKKQEALHLKSVCVFSARVAAIYTFAVFLCITALTMSFVFLFCLSSSYSTVPSCIICPSVYNCCHYIYIRRTTKASPIKCSIIFSVIPTRTYVLEHSGMIIHLYVYIYCAFMTRVN